MSVIDEGFGFVSTPTSSVDGGEGIRSKVREILQTPDENDQQRVRSGEVNIDSKLVSFLYTLLRDHLAAGVVEEIVRDASISSNCGYTNGWLALYANNLANRLK